jgi:hypothetical protein
VGRCFRLNVRTQRVAKLQPELENLGKYANALEGALLAFCVGGSFVIFHYNELIWHVLALSIALDNIVKQRIAVTEAADAKKPVMQPQFAAAMGHYVPPPTRPATSVHGA